MTPPTRTPAIPAPTAKNLLQVNQALKNLLDVREGLIGDPLDANVTFRDLVDSGAVVTRSGWTPSSALTPVQPPWANPDGYDPTQDFTAPMKPEGFTATGLFASISLEWSGAGYRNHAYTEVWRSDTNEIGDAVLIGTTEASLYLDQLGSAATRYYWIRFVSQANVFGPYNAVAGTAATTQSDSSLVLGSLSGQIREEHLYSSLSSRIDLIDAPASTANSVNARIAVVQGQVNDLLNIPAWDSALTYAADAQVTYDGGLYLALQASTNVLPTNTAYWQRIGDYTSLGDAVAAHTTQINDLEDGLGQEVVDRQALAVQLRGNYTGNDLSLVSQGLIYQERTARATAVSAVASEVTTLSALVNTKTKVYYQSSAPANVPAGTLVVGDMWIDTDVTYYDDYAAGDYVIRSNRMYRWSGTQWVEAMDFGFADWFSAINTEKTARVDGDSALASQITSITSLANSNAAAIQNEATTRADTDTALSTSINTLSAQVNNATTGLPATRALLLSDYSTIASRDAAIASATTTLTSSYQAADAATLSSAQSSAQSYTQSYVQGYAYSKAQADSAIATQVNSLSATVNSNNTNLTAALEEEATARASADGSLFAQYTVKTDLAGRVAGFGLASESNAAGVNTTSFAVISDRFSISAPNDYTQEATPTLGLAAGKVWYKPSTKQTFRYDGAAWVSFEPVSPFSVQTTPTTINGVAVPAGVYMDTAFIKNGTIASAKISDLSADKITAGQISAAIGVSTGKIYGGVNIAQPIGSANFGTGFFLGSNSGSYQFFVGSPDKNVTWNGVDLSVRGTVNATAGSVGGITLAGSSAYTTNFIAGSYSSPTTGFRLNASGAIEASKIYSGAFTSYDWPAAGSTGGGFYLGSEGLLIGNGSNNKYFQVTADGNVYAPGFSIVNGGANFSGTVSAATIQGSTYTLIQEGNSTIGGRFLDPRQPNTFLNSTAVAMLNFSGDTNYTIVSGDSLIFYATAEGTTRPANQRIRRGPTIFIINAVGQVDHYFTVWVRYQMAGNWGPWLCLETAVEPQSSYGTAAITTLFSRNFFQDYRVQFGFSAFSESGNYADGNKRSIIYGAITVTAVNF